MSQQIKIIMQEEIEAQGQPSLRKFADWIMEGMSKESDTAISPSTILNWQNGKPPSTDLLEDLIAVYPVSDRRFFFALRMLAIKSPHVWGADGVIWSLKERLERMK